MGSLWLCEEPDASGTSVDQAPFFKALKSFNKSIKAIIASIQSQSADERFIITNCTLFSCIKAVRCHDPGVLSLPRTGQTRVR